MASKDYYKILGVGKGAEPSEIKKAFHRLARDNHPDLNANNQAAEERFKEINEAYAVLSDPGKRKQYDTFGAEGFGQRFSQEDIFRGFDFQSIFSDMGFGSEMGGGIFSDLFGGRGGRRRATRMDFGGGGGPFGGAGGYERSAGQDVQMDLSIGFYESINGGERVVSVPSPQGGREKVVVKIPAGISAGQRLRVRGKGGASPYGGERGNLYLVVKVASDAVFTRDGDDLRCDVQAPLSVMVLGGLVEVPTLDGPKSVKIKAGTQAGTQLRLKGKGVPGANSAVGDLFARVMPRIPVEPSQKVLELFEALAKEGF